MYASIIKLKEGSNRKLLGNVIIFAQDGPEKCSEIFDFPDVMNSTTSLRVAFVGTKEQYEVNRKDVMMSCGELIVRTQNVYNWLRMLKQCNPKYWNITINESDACKLLVINLTKELLDNIEIVDNESSLNVERVVTSDTAEVRRMNTDEKIGG